MAGDELTAPIPAARAEQLRWLAAATAGLPGPARWRADVVAELDDGLREATEAHQAAGLDALAAARQASTDFGNPGDVAAALVDHAAARLGRRVAVALLSTGPLAAATWLTALVAAGAAPWSDSPAGPGRFMLLLGPVVAIGAGAAAAAALLASRASDRPIRWLRPAPAAAAVAATACVLADTGMLIAFLTWAATASPTVGPAAVLAISVSLSRLAIATPAAVRCAEGSTTSDRHTPGETAAG